MERVAVLGVDVVYLAFSHGHTAIATSDLPISLFYSWHPLPETHCLLDMISFRDKLLLLIYNYVYRSNIYNVFQQKFSSSFVLLFSIDCFLFGSVSSFLFYCKYFDRACDISPSLLRPTWAESIPGYSSGRSRITNNICLLANRRQHRDQ